jgi:glycosyltransferase involved in cell wall biosynthesis
VKILFLSKFMLKGYGVSEVIQHLSTELNKLGWEVNVLCENQDDHFKVTTFNSEISMRAVQKTIESLKPDVICAHTSPYIEMLPHINFQGKKIVYDHGEPSPELFKFDQTERHQINLNKWSVYDHVSGVVVISNFIKSDINFADAKVIYNGCDHILDRGPKIKSDVVSDRPLKIGILSRLGIGESYYKNTDLVLKLIDLKNVEVTILGKGTVKEAKKYEEAGINVILNASDQERLDFLRDIDILVSPSLWEGFNLPVVEAQASCTVALAFDTGAHPETTPFIASSLDDLKRNVRNWEEDRDQLYKDSLTAYEFVRKEFQWKRSAETFSRFVLDTPIVKNDGRLIERKNPTFMTITNKIKSVMSYYGFFKGVIFIVLKLARKVRSYFFTN